MYFKFVAAALFFVSLALAGDVGEPDDRCRPDCGPKEEFRTCGGCDPTCENRDPPCPRICRVGCFCIDGFVRDEQGRCIPPELCPQPCNASATTTSTTTTTTTTSTTTEEPYYY